jgi:hypothetical protein
MWVVVKFGLFQLKMVTRLGFVAKIGRFQLKMATRLALVAKIEHFPHQNDDENSSRRQNRTFLN